jgi:hypothetical protein
VHFSHYDARGNRASIIDPVNGSTKPTTFTYDSMNRLKSIAYPGAATTPVRFAYDSRGRRITDQNNKAGWPTHSRSLRMSGVTLTFIRHRLQIASSLHSSCAHTAEAILWRSGSPLHHLQLLSPFPHPGMARRRDSFLKIVEETRQRHRFVVYGYVIMPEHFHLLISEPERGDPSVVMKVVKHRFACKLRRRRRRSKSQMEFWPDADDLESEIGGLR